MSSVGPKFFRPAEVNVLLDNAAKADQKLGWKAHTTLQQILEMMVDADLRWVELEVK